jgi:Flp pilus assembly protein TadG
MSSAMTAVSKMWLRARRSARDLLEDCSAIAATEFAVIVPLMLVLFFGTLEFSSGVAVDRKVTLMARTLSDLTSQSPPTGVADADLSNYFAASNGVMTPYPTAPVNAIISELYVDPNSLQARVQWSKAYQGGTARAVSSTVTIPTALAVAGTYLIFSEVSYLYVPTIGYVMAKSGINLSDVAYTRPRQATCVYYPPAGGLPACPTL